MPLTRSLAAPISCLRCQLRQVILQTRSARCVPRRGQKESLICRSFTTSHHVLQPQEEDGDDVFLRRNRNDDRRKALYRREYPLGRVIGRPGRRQRESSETLKIDSMRRPFDVVLLRDIQEPEVEQGETGVKVVGEIGESHSVSAAEIAEGLLNPDKSADQHEVDRSIDALRPGTNVVDEDQLSKLRTTLSNAYNGQQLSLYLKYLKTQPSADNVERNHPHERDDVQRSVWQPGRTPIEKRHSLSHIVKKGRKSAGKNKTIEAIIRHGWNLVLDSDEQRVGELEMLVKNWQLRYLFDLRSQDQPHYEYIIQPPILRHACEILHHRVDNVVRIVGRRSDAEEVTRLIQAELKQVQKLEVDLKCFKPMRGRPGWPSKLSEIFPRSDSNYVGHHTNTVLDRQSERTIGIYSKSESARQHAKRLLLSLLNLPSPSKIELFDLHEDHVNKRQSLEKMIYVPHTEGDETSSESRKPRRSRLTLPARKSSRSSDDSTAAQSNTQLLSASSVARTLASFQDADRSLSVEQDVAMKRETSYWRMPADLAFSPWQAQLCKVLHSSNYHAESGSLPKTKTREKNAHEATTTEFSMVQPEAPNLAKLLPYLSPRSNCAFAFDESTKPSQLAAHFFPSPFGTAGLHALQKLPRIFLIYQVADEHDRLLELIEAKLVVKHQELRVPLPHESVDVRFTRSLELAANSECLRGDEQIGRFTQTLNRSAVSSADALSGEPAINFKLPQWMADGLKLKDNSEQSEGEVEVEYLHERFEQVQTAEFTPVGPEETSEDAGPVIRQVLESIRQSLFLEYAEVEGGIVGGSKAELNLKYGDTSRSQSDNVKDFTKNDNMRLVEAAFNLASAVTWNDSSGNR